MFLAGCQKDLFDDISFLDSVSSSAKLTALYDITQDNTGATIGWWSAGCQVVNDMDKYRTFIRATKTQKSVTYCLINEF